MTQREPMPGMVPGSFEELKAFVAQFEVLLPEDKRLVIRNAIEEMEAAGGMHSEAQGQAILANLMKGLGL